MRSRFTLFPLTVALIAVGCAGAGATPSVPHPSPAAVPSVAPAVATAAPVQAVVLSEWKVTVANTIKAGSVAFTITNTGVVPHELLVFKTDVAGAAYPTNGTGGIDEELNPPMSDGENIEPGGSQTRTIDLAPGKYLFVCNLPAHYTQGMFTLVTVTP